MLILIYIVMNIKVGFTPSRTANSAGAKTSNEMDNDKKKSYDAEIASISKC